MTRTVRRAIHDEVACIQAHLDCGRRDALSAMAGRLDGLARQADFVAAWHLTLARDILESHLLAVWHLEEAGVSSERCERVLERAVDGAGAHLREVLASEPHRSNDSRPPSVARLPSSHEQQVPECTDRVTPDAD